MKRVYVEEDIKLKKRKKNMKNKEYKKCFNLNDLAFF